MESGWIGVDLDGTLAHYEEWKGPEHIGEPIAPMVLQVRKWIAEGKMVRIFTARAFPLGLVRAADDRLDFQSTNRLEEQANIGIIAIRRWCKEHIGVYLPITCVKDYAMVELWDDRAVRVVYNEGRRCCGGV